MAQELNWKVGDKYKTDGGVVMEIVRVDDGDENRIPWIHAKGEDNFAHFFGSHDGHSVCCFDQILCHGHLRSRITGTIQAA